MLPYETIFSRTRGRINDIKELSDGKIRMDGKTADVLKVYSKECG